MNRVAVIGIVGNSVFLPVEHFHVGGETVEASSIRFELGGKGFNQAVAAARMGTRVSFLAAIGEAELDQVKAFLQNEDIKPMLLAKGAASAFAAIVTDADGANRVTVYQGPQLTAEDVEAFRLEIEQCDILLLNNEVPEEVNLAAASIASGCGKRIILNPAPVRETKRALLDKIAWFTPNEHEAQGLESYPNVIQTLGGQGCLIKAEARILPAMDVKAVDTTGAGDTFNGALAAALSQNSSLEDAVQLAVRASGYSVTKHGAVSSIPYKKDLI